MLESRVFGRSWGCGERRGLAHRHCMWRPAQCQTRRALSTQGAWLAWNSQGLLSFISSQAYATGLCVTPPQAIAVIARTLDAAGSGDMGGDQQRALSKRITQQPAPCRPHALGVGPRHHPVGVLHLDGMVKQVANDVERFAFGVDAHDLVSWGLARRWQNVDPISDGLPRLDQMERATRLENAQRARFQ